jgi:2-alkenal reductase
VPVALSSQLALQPAAAPTQPLTGPTPASAPTLDTTTVVGALEELMIGVYKQVNPSVVHIRVTVGRGRFTQQATGSGFVLDRRGHIVTNNHVVEGATDITVTFADDTEVPAKVVGTDPGSDLAVIAVDLPADSLHPAELGDSDQVVPGQLTIAIGNPFGLEGSMTMGIVSAVGRVIQPEASRFSIAHMIQTDAPINPGNSGGPLLDSQGRVIGVNTLIFSQTGTSAGVGFAVPVNTVKRVVPELIARGRYDHPWLGISGYSITPRLARELDLPAERGVLIGDVDANGPAARAGLRGGSRQVVVDGTPFIVGGDMVIAIDGRPVKSMDDIIGYLEEERQVGDVVRLTVLRAGQEREITVRLAARP